MVNQTQSFVQNIIGLALAKGIPVNKIGNLLGISNTKLVASALIKNSFPNRDVMTTEQAESAISEVAPEYGPELRGLQGYPESTVDIFMQEVIKQDPENDAIQTLQEICFGQAYRLNRLQVPISVDGKYLRIADSIVPGVNTARLSEIERGIGSVRLSTSFMLISKLGFRPDESGLENFFKETGKLLQAYIRRTKEFGRALFIHLYPDGKLQGLAWTGQTVIQRDIYDLIGGSAGRIRNMFAGEDIPTIAETAKIIGLFKYSDESQFYAEANKRYVEAPHIAPPINTRSEAMAQFGNMVRLIREEVGITQITFHSFINGGTMRGNEQLPANNMRITYLESGKRKLPLSTEEQLDIIKAFGLNDIFTFRQLTTDIDLARQYSDKHFYDALSKLAELGNDTAGHVVAGKYGDKNFTPVKIRNAAQMLGMQEAEIYKAAGFQISESLAKAFANISTFLQDTPLKNVERNERVGRTSGSKGQLAFKG